MRLYELTGVKRFQKYTIHQLYKLLEKLGIHIINGGSYGTILTSSKWNYVVKLFESDPYYLSFVKFVLAHPNKHYPKFGRAPLEMHAFYTRDFNASDKMWLLKIEKLQELDKQTSEYLILNLDHAQTVAYWLDTEHTRQQSKEYLDVNPSHRAPFTYMDGSKHKVSTREWAMAHEWLISVARAYRAIFMNDDIMGAEDFHARNFMKRSDGTIVIIDPVWEGSNPYKEYDAWYRTITDADNGGEYDEQPLKVGPRYDYQIKRDSEEKLKAKKSPPAYDDADDDIPF